MPGRSTNLITNEIYHIYNRGINHCPTFLHKFEYLRAVETLNFYRIDKPPIKLSEYLSLEEEKQMVIDRVIAQQDPMVDIYCYCLMPNHFHLLLKQLRENGISRFLGNFENSFTRYSNTKNKRDGSLFLDQFKAERIETDEQLIHVSRYIHLNPYTSFLVKDLCSLENYPWSSFPDYVFSNESFVKKDFLLSFFNNNIETYKNFVFDQADSQRKLDQIRHLIFE